MRDHYDRGPSRKDSNRYDNRDRRSNYRDDRNSDRVEREMFPAVCDECGRDCEVPFRPSSDKPIYCLDCYEKMNGSNQRRDSFKADRVNGDSNIQRQLDDINHKLYKILKLLESKPSEPVYNKMSPVKKKAKKEEAEKSFDAILKQLDDIENKQ